MSVLRYRKDDPALSQIFSHPIFHAQAMCYVACKCVPQLREALQAAAVVPKHNPHERRAGLGIVEMLRLDDQAAVPGKKTYGFRYYSRGAGTSYRENEPRCLGGR